LTRKEIIENLSSSTFGKKLYFYPKIDSTNKVALQLAKEGAAEGTIVCAGYQTLGKGRFNRVWSAEADKNMLISFILRPKAPARHLQRITLAAAVILKNYLDFFLKKNDLFAPNFSLKWPNDILVKNRKIAGILMQSVWAGNEIEALVMGVGLNVNGSIEQFPEELQSVVTSLCYECGVPIKLHQITAGFISYFEREYIKLEQNNYSHVVANWKKQCKQFGNKIRVSLPTADKINAEFYDINENGNLMYRLADGSINHLTTGEITFV
jgi:BirA family biotin operon repressor/biotin-[acetyl-CoA-carboxylase] ligase